LGGRVENCNQKLRGESRHKKHPNGVLDQRDRGKKKKKNFGVTRAGGTKKKGGPFGKYFLDCKEGSRQVGKAIWPVESRLFGWWRLLGGRRE